MYIIKEKPEDFIVEEVPSINPCEEGDYSYFIMKKRNMTTVDAIMAIAVFLRIPMKEIGFAGNKDKRAVTEQYISVPGKHEKRLRKFRNKKISLEFAGNGNERITLGCLKGNWFEIIVKNANEPKEVGRFINYFGEQRISENNVAIGKSLIKGNLGKAAELANEYPVKRHLKEHPRDFAGALKRLPQKILSLYINAYQSWLWNTAVDEFISSHKDSINDDLAVEIIGFGTEFSDKEIEKIYSRIIRRESITFRDFIVRSMRNLSSEGDIRKVFVKPEQLSIEKVNKKSYRLKFFLPKGCYATELIRQMFG